jgi:hypothetical protein
MKKQNIILLTAALLCTLHASATDYLFEAESFTHKDMTGFNGRCDAIYFTTDEHQTPPSEVAELDRFRRKALNQPDMPDMVGTFDFVVVGRGITEMSSAIADINEDVTEGFRYLHWVINDTNTGQRFLHICEITFWGSYTEWLFNNS